MSGIQYAIDGTAQRLIDGLLMVPVAAGFILLAIVAVWYLNEYGRDR